jgi:hypothetical protein
MNGAVSPFGFCGHGLYGKIAVFFDGKLICISEESQGKKE